MKNMQDGVPPGPGLGITGFKLLSTSSSTPLNKLQPSSLANLVRARSSAKPTGDSLLKRAALPEKQELVFQASFTTSVIWLSLRQLDERSFITPSDFLLSTDCCYQDENRESKEADPAETSQLDEAFDTEVHQREFIWRTCLMRSHDN